MKSSRSKGRVRTGGAGGYLAGMSTPASRLTTYAEYLALERASDQKHEFLDGHIYAMAGGTPEHAGLCASVARLLGNSLAGKPCRIFSSDLRVRIVATGLSTYPDVTVVCGQLERPPEDRDAATNPIVLVEVLSDSTEEYDRGDKSGHYRRIESLRAYVLVSQKSRRIEVAVRNDDRSWTLREYTEGAAPIPPLDCALAVGEVYANPLGD